MTGYMSNVHTDFRIILGLCFSFLCSFNLQAEEFYYSVDEYVQAATKTKINLKDQNYQKHYRAASKNKRWHVGFAREGGSETSFLYILEANKQGKLRLASISSRGPEDRPSNFLVDEILMDANDRFLVGFATSQSRYNYYFQLMNNKWYLVGADHVDMAQCGKGENSETFYSLEASTNYLTGEIKEQRYHERDCKPFKLVRKKGRFPLIPFSNFYPFMEIESLSSIKRVR